MMNKIQVKKMAQHILRHNKGIKKRQIMHPIREWSIGLASCLIIFTAFSVWSTQVFLEYREITVETQSASSGDTSVYRKAMVEEALGIFSEREKVFGELLNTDADLYLEPVLETVEFSGENSTSTEDTVLDIQTSSSSETVVTEEGLEVENEVGVGETATSS